MKRFFTLLLCVLLVGSLCACGSEEESVSVQAVSMVAGGGGMLVDRCAGKVVSGDTAKLSKDSGKTVLEVLVQEGDMVAEGDLLFRYDAAAMELELEKLRLEKQGMENTIATATADIEELERQKAMVYVTNQLSYTIQIDTKKADLREAEYNKVIKEREIANMEKALESTDVTSPISGRVMSVSDESGSGGMEGQEGDSFITVMDISHYRIQGTLNELNMGTLYEGMEVLVRSRMDSELVWHGRIESIDWENPVTGNDNQMYYIGPTDEMTSSSKYPFYVELDSTEGLILGQHVYVEPDFGQDRHAEGLWLPAYYICDMDSSPYVWAANSRDRLEKRSVVLGEEDAELGLRQITGGLTVTDYIAFPQEGLSAGRSVDRYSEANFGGDAAVFASDGDAMVYASDGDAAVYASDGDALIVQEILLEEGAVG
ncbi:MAG: efflux RND transporter periplasmic adaptor subunit [Oscillospiraceae bacterium]|nr:efflux RND transporter periplasmic adaptor subunit [Oscillospiraceae bacterium]